jgi:TonB family protein
LARRATGSRAALRRPPLLASSAAPCRGYFPVRAAAKHGVVRIHVRVDATGRAQLSHVLIEAPSSQGFGAAAAACAARLRFSPAIDGDGAAVPSEAKLELLFERS